jgi:C_GCAxxG_C_C family probable redox protein
MKEIAAAARAFHDEGYNCCQSVILPFIREMDVDEEALLKAASSLGGGLGYLREVCGAVSGMAVVLGLKYGYRCGFKDQADKDAKAAHYALVKRLGEEFKERMGALTCRDLLHMDEYDRVLPGFEDIEKPCPDAIAVAADILSDYLATQDK